MSLSIFDLFKIGIGPSSSHTVGPVIAANRFIAALKQHGRFAATARVKANLYGSLAMTGKGHSTDIAVMLGLLGEKVDTVDPDQVEAYIAQIYREKKLNLNAEQLIQFDPEHELVMNFGESLEQHPNGMRLTAYDSAGIIILNEVYFSVGGGFVLSLDEICNTDADANPLFVEPYPFNSAAELLQQANQAGLSIAELVLANEAVRPNADSISERVLNLWEVMHNCIKRGCEETGYLPGGLKIRRRANKLRNQLINEPEKALQDPLTLMDWVNLYAMAVNEENAAGGRVVTAPTNGAAGVIPAVLAYYVKFVPGANEDGIVKFIATAAAIGMLYKKNASISAAEVGCQGEIGVACSMAAGALCAVTGGNNAQVENAAEIGMEHNLGLTCDPIGGLVQVPCIERNTMGSMKAINAARLALRGDGEHHVTLDAVIETMRQTGLDMQDKYKETSTGGLAVNAVAC
ncbi:MAG: L-serine ammonia-lyase [Oceanospirillaceae bacterium]|nr:L-serine ammonia-lyase [Oceanospirillaceae bacterium]